MNEVEIKTVLDIETGQLWYEILEGKYKGVRLNRSDEKEETYNGFSYIWMATEENKIGKGETPQYALWDLRNYK